MKGLFITGSDTNVGKTYIACQIATQLRLRGINVIPRKPVESGCLIKNGKLIPSDALSLQQAAQSLEPINKICPFQFSEAMSPARAARLNNKTITLNQLTDACSHNMDNNSFLLVEGAGGFYSPICDKSLNADLARQLKLPVLLIIEDKIGCINQAFLNLAAIKFYGLSTSAIVLNQISNTGNVNLANSEELALYTDTPIFNSHSTTTLKKLIETLIK